MIVKDSTKKSGYRERIVHNVKFTFTGVESFIIPLQKYLVEKGIVSKETKLNYSKAKTQILLLKKMCVLWNILVENKCVICMNLCIINL